MSTTSSTIEDAKKASAKAERKESDQYREVEDREPHEPEYLSQKERRDTRIAEPEYNCQQLPDPVVTEVDGKQLPMKLSEAREQYIALKRNQMNTDGWRSPLDHAKDLYGRALGAERELVDQLQSPSLLFLSLRQSPVEFNRGRGRRWIEPLRLRSELNHAWQNVRQTLYRKLSGYDRWEYVRVCGYTRAASTSHYHLLVYVEDPLNQLSLSTARSAVDSYVKANDYADKKHHNVEADQSDAGILTHSVPREDDRIPTESYKRVLEYRDGDSFKPSSSFLIYMMSQYPHFVLDHIWDGTSDLHEHDPLVDGATVSWVSQFDDYGSSRGFPDTPD